MNKKLLFLLFLSLVISLTVVAFLIIKISLPKKILASGKSANLEVIFLDVGQGDSILIKTPFYQNILIDGGEDEKVIKRLGEVLPWWDKNIDLMILSHPHGDHVAGLVAVIERYDVEKILYNGATHNSPDYIAWLRTIKEKNIDLSIINKKQKVLLGKNCYIEFLYPLSKEDVDRQDNLNNTSIVARLVYEETSFLFSGDAEEKVEKILEIYGDKLKSDVLKVGHHGSDTSSRENFLEIVHPKYAVIEVGADNNFGHPSLRILKRLERIPATIFRTDRDGSIKFVSDGKNLFKID